MTNKQPLTDESARESGNILLIVAARMARRELFTPLHYVSELPKKVVSMRVLREALERSEETLQHEVCKIVDGHNRMAKKLKEAEGKLQAAEKRLSEITAPNMLLPVIDNLDENQLRNVIKTCTENYSLLHSKCEAAEKRVAELEAVKFKLSESKLLLLAKDIVENLVDTGSSEPEYTQQYLDWTCKRIRAAGRTNGEG